MPTFAVLAHTDPDQLSRLATSLAPWPVLVHLDARADRGSFALPANAQFIEPREKINWGSMRIIAATEHLYREALRVTSPDDYVVLLSGQDQLVRPLGELVDFLRQADGRQFANSAAVYDGTFYGENRLRLRWHPDLFPRRRRGLLNLFNRTGERALRHLSPRLNRYRFGAMEPVAGSQWTAFTAACLHDLVSEAQGPVRKLFAHSLAPDEMLYQSLYANSAWGRKDGVHPPVTRWQKDQRVFGALSNLHLIDPSLARFFTADDATEITQSGKFFVRKVRSQDAAALAAALGVSP